VNTSSPIGCYVAAICLLAACGAGIVGCHRSTSESAGSEPHGPAEPASGVSLKPDEIRKLGIEVTPAVATRQAPEASGFGVVLAHEQIALSVAEWMTAVAVERQSDASLRRVQRLSGTAGAMSAEARESTERQASIDRAALLLTRQRLTSSFGQTPPWNADWNSPLLHALAGGETKLVRVTFPLGMLDEGNPHTLRFARVGVRSTGGTWTSTTIWRAPADTSVPGISFFALLTGNGAGEGERLIAWSPTGVPEPGVLVPASAAILSAGKLWCYVEKSPGIFVRTELDPRMLVDDGYFVKDGIAAQEPVVTHSAGLLLAHEMNPSTAAD
jgi:hypothetical protein